jgi:hypothetical protein
MAFDSNAMQELAALSRDRYQRAGGGGAHRVYASAKAFDDARGYKDMSPWQQLVYRTNLAWRDACAGTQAAFRQDCYLWERDSVETRCSYVQARKQWGLSDEIPF